MPQPFTATGGARIGWTNALIPLAQLSATPETLTISSDLLGTYSFTPDQVSSLERYVTIPVFGWGVQIRHCNSDYPERVIFWCLGHPAKILQGIRDSGFVPNASSPETPKRRGIPMRWSAILIAVAVWSVLYFFAIGRFGQFPPQPGPLTWSPLFFAFAFSIGALTWPGLQRILLMPGRNVSEITPFFRFLALISGILLVIALFS
jgi:hypothetical protein